ncbi:acyltransferase family protein [Lacinutrix sp. WUR7]|nr:acyltransferase family protein [Lacinutrix sp. WUR7]
MIPPLVFWSLIYIAYSVFVVGDNNILFFDLVKKIIRNLLHGSKFHLWFVYTLLGLYLFIPILRKWVKQAHKKEFHYFLILWFATTLYAIPALKLYLPNLELVNFSGYLGYLVLGYYLSKLKIKNKILPSLCIVIGVAITFFGTYYSTKTNGDFEQYFYGYLSPNVMLSAIGIFLLFKSISFKSNIAEKVSSFISNHSFGIYLVHVLVLSVMSTYGIDWKFMHPIFSIPITKAICLLISSLIIYLLRKIKYADYISG